MSNTIQNFIVGMGYEYDTQGEQNITSGLDKIGGKVLQLGAVIAGGFGLSELTTGFANAKDELGKFSQSLDVVPSDVNALGQALEHNGGSLQSFMGQLQTLTSLRDGLLAGDAGFLGELGKFGIDGSVIADAENATDAYIMLADQIASVSKEQARGAIGVLGFDAASLALLQNGTDEVRRIMAEERGVRDVTDEMVEEAARFNDASQRTSDLMGGFADQISMVILPGINDAMDALNESLEGNSPELNKAISVLGFAGKVGASTVKDFATPHIEETMEFWSPRIDAVGDFFSSFRDTEPQTYSDKLHEQIKAQAPQQQIPPITANLHLDGRIIDTRIINVMGAEAQTAIDDLSSSVDR